MARNFGLQHNYRGGSLIRPGAGGGGGGGPHQYWRVFVNSGLSSSFLTLPLVEAATVVGGADIAAGNTYAASSTQGANLPANAFDGNPATTWQSALNGTVGGWLSIDFGTPVDIAEWRIGIQTESELFMPVDFEFQYSDDNVAWTTSFSVVSSYWDFTNDEVRTFVRPDVGVPTNPTAQYWRLFTSASNGSSLIAREIMLLDISGNDVIRTNATSVSASSALSSEANAIDSNVNTQWLASTANDEWIAFDMGTDVSVETVVWRLGTSTASAPKDFQLQYSDDGINWTEAYNFVGETAWAANCSRVFGAADNVVASPFITGADTYFLDPAGNLAASTYSQMTFATSFTPSAFGYLLNMNSGGMAYYLSGTGLVRITLRDGNYDQPLNGFTTAQQVAMGVKQELLITLDMGLEVVDVWLDGVKETIPIGTNNGFLFNRRLYGLARAVATPDQFTSGEFDDFTVWLNEYSSDGSRPTATPYVELKGPAATLNADPWKQGADVTDA